MKIVKCAFSILLFCSSAGAAQKGTAESGFYPFGYNGDTWTGVVTAANDDKREITLTYTKGDKTQTFVAVVPDGYVGWMKDESGDRVITVWPKGKNDKPPKVEPLHLNLADLTDRRLMVYYMAQESKVGDQKVKINQVIRIKILPKANN